MRPLVTRHSSLVTACAAALAAFAAPALDFSQVAAVTIPEGAVESISTLGGEVLWKRLPYDAEVEYLESTGTQWIDTGVVPDASTVCSAENMFIGSATQQFGSGRASSDRWAVLFGHYQGAARLWVGVSQVTISLNKVSGVRFSCGFDLAHSTYSVDGVSKYNTKIDVPTGETQSFALFGRKNSNTSYSALCKMRVYSFSISSSTASVDFQPVRVGTVGYMFDRVSGELFGNQGTGAFVVGPDKTNAGE